MKHIFDVAIAKEYGVIEAVLLEHIGFWIRHNAANNTNYHDGRYWTFNSRKAFCQLFPYLTEEKIRYAVDKLINKGLVIKGNYNQKKMDRTTWYALTDEGLKLCEIPQCICENSQMEVGKSPNGSGKIPRAIPYINTDINTDVADASDYNPITDLQYTLGFLPTGYQAEKFMELYKEVGEVIYHKALKKAADANARNYKYVESTARGIAEGKDFDNKPKEEEQTEVSTSHITLTEEEKAYYYKLKAQWAEEKKNG